MGRLYGRRRRSIVAASSAGGTPCRGSLAGRQGRRFPRLGEKRGLLAGLPFRQAAKMKSSLDSVVTFPALKLIVTVSTPTVPPAEAPRSTVLPLMRNWSKLVMP